MVNELEKKVVIVLFNGIVFNNKCVYAYVCIKLYTHIQQKMHNTWINLETSL